MTKSRVSVTVDETVLQAVRARAARRHTTISTEIEGALRRDLGLDVLERVWARSALNEEQAVELALEAQRWARKQ